MLEATLCSAACGLLLANRRSLGVGNPFLVYFSVWFALFLGYAWTRGSFVGVSVELLFAMFCSMVVALALLVANSLQRDLRRHALPRLETIGTRRLPFILAQIVVTAALAPVLVRAQSMSGGESIFTGIGFVRLRQAMTQGGQDFGVLSYFFMLSFVLSSVALAVARSKQLPIWLVGVSLATSFTYAYVSTGRTFFLLLFCMLFAPLVITRRVRVVGIAAVVTSLIAAFVLVSVLTGKGVHVEVGFVHGARFFLEELRSYTIAPLLAFAELVDARIDAEYGVNTLRFFVSVSRAVGITDLQPVALIKEYAYVPDATNVYTVYEPYFRDFLSLGFVVPPAFLILHEWLFRKTSNVGGIWIFYYSVSVYPLAMQFFQDQYASLLSQWIQVAFWYFVIVKPARTEVASAGT